MALFVLGLLLISFLMGSSESQLFQVGFYSNTCPQVESIVRAVVREAVISDTNMAAVLLRLHFHDCFVEVSSLYLITKIYLVLLFHRF